MFKYILGLVLCLSITSISCIKDTTAKPNEFEWIRNLDADAFKSLTAAVAAKDPKLFKLTKASPKICFACFDWEALYTRWSYCDTFANPDMYPDNSPEYQSIMSDCMTEGEQ